MNSAISGSVLWQTVFISFAIVLVLFEVVRGWRLGLMRQFARLGGLIAAYAAAFFGGRLIVPMVRPFLKMPDVVISALGGALLAILVYLIISSLGRILFKRTGQQHSVFVRFFYGSTGALLGVFFGAFLVWLIVVGIRAIGAVADAQVRGQASSGAAQPQSLHAVELRRRLLTESNEEPATLITSLARLKNSLELGTLGDVVKQADVIPTEAYETLGKVGKLLSDPEIAQRFLTFPGARELSEHPKIVALRDDPEIAEMIGQGRYIELLQNQKILDALNDPTLVDQLKRFELSNALDYALKEE